jgi:hypothetical protein
MAGHKQQEQDLVQHQGASVLQHQVLVLQHQQGSVNQRQVALAEAGLEAHLQHHRLVQRQQAK